MIQDFLNENITLLYVSSNTCSVCGVMKQKIENFLKEYYPDLELTEVKIDENPFLKGDLMIFSVPAIILYYEKKEIYRKAGYLNIAELGDMLDKIYTA
jgi:thioredoxin-like negative regulator of GroEL